MKDKTLSFNILIIMNAFLFLFDFFFKYQEIWPIIKEQWSLHAYITAFNCKRVNELPKTLWTQHHAASSPYSCEVCRLLRNCFHCRGLSSRALHKGFLCVSRQLLISLCLRAFTVLCWPCCFRHLFEFYSHSASHCLQQAALSSALSLCLSQNS